ncbi:MAG TPA: hypothetical protein GXX72_07735 [Clostridiaceae bacterium]|nr:hypothetical protein [Clostridiaceae bacterium]
MMANKQKNNHGYQSYSDDPLIKRIWNVGIGRFFLILLAFLLLVLLDVAISLNNVNTFLIIFGIEVLVAFVVGWIYFFLRQRES